MITKDILLQLLHSQYKWDLFQLLYGDSAEHFAAIKNLYSECVINPMLELLTLQGVSYRSFFNFKTLFISFVIVMNLKTVDRVNIPGWMTQEMIDNSLYFYNSAGKWTFLYMFAHNYLFVNYVINKKGQFEEIFLSRVADYMYTNILSGNVSLEFIEFINKIIIS